MARVAVRIADLEQGDLPAVSVKSGRPCDNAVAITLRPGSRLLSPGGKKLIAVLPLEAGRARLYRWMTRLSWVVLVLFVASLVVGIVTDIGLVPATIAFVIYAVLVIVGDALWIGAQTGAEDNAVVLTKVHAAFEAAVTEQYRPAAPEEASESTRDLGATELP